MGEQTPANGTSGRRARKACTQCRQQKVFNPRKQDNISLHLPTQLAKLPESDSVFRPDAMSMSCSHVLGVSKSKQTALSPTPLNESTSAESFINYRMRQIYYDVNSTADPRQRRRATEFQAQQAEKIMALCVMMRAARRE